MQSLQRGLAMFHHTLFVDRDKCVGCHACEVACKQENSLPDGPGWIQVVRVGPYEVGLKLKLDFVAVRCMHCDKPPCVDACPTKAIKKRADGIVLVDEEKCNGCRNCVEVCPFGAPKFNAVRGIIGMCTMCVHRIDKGLEPSCVKNCISGALSLGYINTTTKSEPNI